MRRKPELEIHVSLEASSYTMTILDGGDDQELLRLWALIAELSEELSQNRTLAVSLYSQANNVKVCFDHLHPLELGHPHSNLNVRRTSPFTRRRGLFYGGASVRRHTVES